MLRGKRHMIVKSIFIIIWLIFTAHYYDVLRFYIYNYQWFNTTKVLYMVFVVESWMLISIIMLTWCVYKWLE